MMAAGDPEERNPASSAAEAIPRSEGRGIAVWVVAFLGTLLAMPFTLSLGLGNSLSHDEHQHIAAGVLFAREGLLPYRDFLYFHLPYLVYVYGFLFQVTDQYLLAARLFSAACAALTCGVVCGVAWKIFSARPAGQRVGITLGAFLLLVSSPLFYNSVGHAWNQEPSVLLAVLALLAIADAVVRERPNGRLLLSGALLGVAIGLRVTMAPLVLPLAIFAAFSATGWPARFRRVLVFGLGIALALIPAAWSFLTAPEAFVFANVEFPGVNVTYRLATGDPRTMTLLKKLRFVFKEVARPDWVLVSGLFAAGILAWFTAKARSGPYRYSMGLLACLPFFFLGAVAPSPAYDQYYYPFAPVLVLTILCLFGAVGKTRWDRAIAATASILVIVATATAARQYDDLDDLFHPRAWEPSEMQAQAAELRRAVPQGKVLTLGPTSALVAGLRIYPAFATGPFAWRVAPFVAKERRPSLGLVGPEELAQMVASDPPAAILTGVEKRGEQPLKQVARANGYRLMVLSSGEQLWVAPAPLGNGAGVP